jgi:four helix bundle protein
MKYKDFEELPVWKEAITLTKVIYDLTAKKTWRKDFGLTNQIRRAVVSISSNIAEGFEKRNNNELSRYLRIAKGSVGEVRNQLLIASNIGYISEEELKEIKDKLIKLSKNIGGFINYLSKYKKLKST